MFIPGVVRHTLINRNYALFMAGSFVSAVGSWFQAVALGWLVLELTDSPFVLGLANFAQMAPLFFLGFFGGAAADRVDRRTLLLWGIGVGTVATGTLAMFAFAGRASVPAVLAVSLVLGLTNVVVWPAWQPFITEIVPEHRMRDAIAFNSARFNLTRVIGPALAGILMARVGAPACLALAAASSAAVLIVTWLIRPARRRRAAVLPWLSALAEGLAYVRQDGFTLRLLAITGVFGVLVLPYQTFLPAFARDVLATGAEGLGVLLTAVGGGAVLGALITGSPIVAARPAWTMALTALVTGLTLAVFAAATPARGLPAWVATISLVAVGFASIAYLTTANATLQLRVPEHLMGRVMGLWVVMNAGTVPLGSLALGGAAERFGLPEVIMVCGLVGVALGAFALLSRALASDR